MAKRVAKREADASETVPMSSPLTRRLAQSALAKRKAGETPTRPETAALRRWEAEEEERTRWRVYASIPQKHWRAMSGRQAKQIKEQADRYGIPFGGAAVDLPAVVRSLHAFLAENARKLADDDGGDGGDGGSSSERYKRWRARLTEEKALTAQLFRRQREGELVEWASVHEWGARFAAHVRNLGERLERRYGPEALELLDDALDEIARELDRVPGAGKGES